MTKLMIDTPFIIAVDGPAASGKGTLARALAAHYNLPHLDTGLLYRATAFLMLENNIALEDEDAAVALAKTITPELLANEQLRAPHMGNSASVIAKKQSVRDALLDFQRDFTKALPGAVLDGRDIGTVICPDATLKLFVTADLKERAKRRHKELIEKGKTVTLDEIEASLSLRDARDGQRDNAPLTKADDAHLLNTTKLDIEEAVKHAISLADEALTQKCDRKTN